MPEFTPEPDSTGGESKKKKRIFIITFSFEFFLS
jgi:hypothetical protein